MNGHFGVITVIFAVPSNQNEYTQLSSDTVLQTILHNLRQIISEEGTTADGLAEYEKGSRPLGSIRLGAGIFAESKNVGREKMSSPICYLF